MRGTDDKQDMMFTLISPEKRVPADHPLRAIKAGAEHVLKQMSPTFEVMYSRSIGISNGVLFKPPQYPTPQMA